MEKALEQEHPVKAFGWAARDASGYLSPFSFSRRPRGDEDVRFKVLYCGMCHTDLHNIKNEWGISMYPMVPGYGSSTHVILIFIRRVILEKPKF
ncbi:hypothetical protein DVH24_021306 [Malus domestica]|uniref:Uncharacterized protein n=1 Tax=Malus domestica TaxID=3750 RepID=A0A498HRQ1_MALDO|nr:hypothetical protein DVH24_021306 [Malus domestica]